MYSLVVIFLVNNLDPRTSCLSDMRERAGAKVKLGGIHLRNLQVIATVMYKVRKGIVPEIVNNIFLRYNFRYSDFKTK